MRALLALALFLFFSVTSIGQNTDAKCPSVSVIGPAGLTWPGDSMTFVATVSGDNVPSSLKYSWTVSAGVIADGQGTASIVVLTTKEQAGMNVTASVEIGGLPKTCLQIASETTGIAPPVGCGAPMDEYGLLRWSDERARLDNLLIMINNNPESTAFLIIEYGNTETLDSTKKYIAKILKFINSRQRNFDLGRFTFAIEKREAPGRTTKLWLVPRDAELPSCSGSCTIINGRDVKL